MKVVPYVNIIAIILSNAFSKTTDSVTENESIKPQIPTTLPKEPEYKVSSLENNTTFIQEYKIATLASLTKEIAFEGTSAVNTFLYDLKQKFVYRARDYEEGIDGDLEWNKVKYFSIGIWVVIILTNTIVFIVVTRKTWMKSQHVSDTVERLRSLGRRASDTMVRARTLGREASERMARRTSDRVARMRTLGREASDRMAKQATDRVTRMRTLGRQASDTMARVGKQIKGLPTRKRRQYDLRTEGIEISEIPTAPADVSMTSKNKNKNRNRNRDRKQKPHRSDSSGLVGHMLSEFIDPYGHQRTNNNNSVIQIGSKVKNLMKHSLRNQGSSEEIQLLLEKKPQKKGKASRERVTSADKSYGNSRRLHRR